MLSESVGEQFILEAAQIMEGIVSQQAELSMLDHFYDNSGNLILEEPRNIELVQGDGRRATVTLYGNDTIADVVDKLNDAIHSPDGLNQQRLGDGLEGSYVQYVEEGSEQNDTLFSTAGTLVMQSAVAGRAGEISLVGDENILQALGLETIRASSESRYTVEVKDAHTGEYVEGGNGVHITGNMLQGVIDHSVDVEFYHSAGIREGGSVFEGGFMEINTAFDEYSDEARQQIHLADNTMKFHIGANPMQNVAAAMGDMRADALGVGNLIVTNQDGVNRAIEQVDNAIERVSSERSRAGAVQNRLDHTIANLGVAEENLTAAESRIRDLDMAEEMVEFTRSQIMMQAGSFMLAQANMKPEAVLVLLG